jgi:hypothetical protein
MSAFAIGLLTFARVSGPPRSFRYGFIVISPAPLRDALAAAGK